MGFLVPDDEGSEPSFACFFPDFLAAGFTEGSCLREKRSEVALGMFCSRSKKRNVSGSNKKWEIKFPDPPAKLGEQKLSDNAQPSLTRSATDHHGHHHKRPRDRNKDRLPSNPLGNGGCVLRVRGKLFRVHRQLRQSQKILMTQQRERGQLKYLTTSRRSKGKQP